MAEGLGHLGSESRMTAVEAEKLLWDALEQFFEKDADFPKDANERAATHRLAVWIELLLFSRVRGLSIDCEYNREGSEPKRLELKLRELASRRSRSGCDMRSRVYPDIIVHRRGEDGPNVMVVEVKRVNAPDKSLEFDREKLRLYTQEFGYHHAFLVQLGRTRTESEVERVDGVVR